MFLRGRDRKEKRESVQPQAPSTEAQNCECASENLLFAELLGRDYSYRSLGPVYACIELISNAISSMPLTVCKIDEHGHKEVIKHDPLQVIFKSKNVQTAAQVNNKEAIRLMTYLYIV